MRKNIIILIILVVIVVLALILFNSRKASAPPSGEMAMPQPTPGANVNISVPNQGVQIQSTLVAIQNYSFSPSTLTVPKGATVNWVERDAVSHTVTANDNTFKSKTLNQGDEFSFTFSQPGTYNYHCSIHPSMQGTIIVK